MDFVPMDGVEAIANKVLQHIGDEMCVYAWGGSNYQQLQVQNVYMQNM